MEHTIFTFDLRVLEAEIVDNKLEIRLPSRPLGPEFMDHMRGMERETDLTPEECDNLRGLIYRFLDDRMLKAALADARI